MRSRVMPGSLVTMDRRVPVKRLKSVDLPTLGRRTMTRDGGRAVMNWGRSAIFQCTAGKREREEAVREVSVEARSCSMRRRGGGGYPPPAILYRYQNKGVTKLDFCK